MPTTIDPQPLLNEANCTFCVIPSGLIQYAILAALQDVANGDPVPSDPQELIYEARCLECTIPAGFVPYAMLAAISNISGGGGGASQIVAYTTTDPNTDGVVPPDQTKPAIAVKPFSTTFVWITPAGPWDV